MLDLGFLTRSRVRLVRQTEIAECGLASLTMVANFHGLDIDLGTMRRRFAPSLRGAALKTLIGLADQIGLTPRAVKLPLEQLPNLHVPAVLHWDMNHYVVLERVKGEKALIHNPDGRSTWMAMAEVSQHFTGVALELRSSNDFQTGKQRERLRLSQLWQRMTGIKRALLQVLVLTLVLQAFVLASPYYMQLAIDQALPALDHDLLTVLALGFGLFTLINAGAALLRSFVLLVAGTSIGFSLASNIARRLFRLPIDWFEKRHTGDILSRFQSVAPIHDDIIRMPMQYETLVGDMGSTLSGGQKQRVLLARALYRQPKILVMDEGTAHLDVQHEQAVNAAIAAMGITRIIIAHRQETIAQAERVLVMAGGQLHDLRHLTEQQQPAPSLDSKPNEGNAP